MINTEEIQNLIDSGTVVGTNDTKVGKVGQVFVDNQTGQPAWVTVKTGLFGGEESFVPLTDATTSGDVIQVPFDKDKVKGAPRVADPEHHLAPNEEADLYRYYGMDYSGTATTDSAADSGTATSESAADSGRPDSGRPDAARGDAAPTDRPENAVGRDTSGSTTGDAMTRSEEQVHIGKEQVSGGTARLRKFVVTENVTQTVPVSHEEVRVEREPITEANRGAATTGADLSDEEQEVTLTEERVTVDKETVPVERVRMNTETVTEEQQVSEEVRKEQIEADTPETPDGTGRRDSGAR